MSTSAFDTIRVNDLQLTVLLHAGSRWPAKLRAVERGGERPLKLTVGTPQPILLTLSVPHSTQRTALTDDLSHSINYSSLAGGLRGALGTGQDFDSLEHVLYRAFDFLLGDSNATPTLPAARIKITQLRPPLHCQTACVEAEAVRAPAPVSSLSQRRTQTTWNLTCLSHTLAALDVPCIIGVNEVERLEKQVVRVDITVKTPIDVRQEQEKEDLESEEKQEKEEWEMDFRALSRMLYEKISQTTYLTLEALASFIARETLQHLRSQPLNDHTQSASNLESSSSSNDTSTLNDSHRPSLHSRGDDDFIWTRNGGESFNPTVTISARKPSALVFAESAEVEIVRRWEDYFASASSSSISPDSSSTNLLPLHLQPYPALDATPEEESQIKKTKTHKEKTKYNIAALALGSNLGDRFANIETALRLLERPVEVLASVNRNLQKEGGVDVEEEKMERKEITANEAETDDPPELSIVNTSFLYETPPMYVTDQGAFVNCAVLIHTTLAPPALLQLCKAVEALIGRPLGPEGETRGRRFGERVVDVDIVLYEGDGSRDEGTDVKGDVELGAGVKGDVELGLVMDTRALDARATLDNLSGELVIPHPRMGEREFVLRPLVDMLPNTVHPLTRKPLKGMLDDLLLSSFQRPEEEGEGWFPMERVIPFPNTSPDVPDRSRNPHSLPTSLSSIPIDPVPPTLTYWRHPCPPPAATITSSVSAKPAMKKSRHTKTYLMATLNVTPDSFSEGSGPGSSPPSNAASFSSTPAPALSSSRPSSEGRNDTIPSALAYAFSSAHSGASIIDIGGYSTRPGAGYVSVAEETRRVVGAVRAIRGAGKEGPGGEGESGGSGARNTTMDSIPLSIDTFRPEVAEEAIRAGANCINDVYAFTGPGWGGGEEEWVSLPQPSVPAPRASTSTSTSTSSQFASTSSSTSTSALSKETTSTGLGLGEEAYYSPADPEHNKSPGEYMSSMKHIARQYAVPVVLMHSRGDAGRNKDYSMYNYIDDGQDDGSSTSMSTKANNTDVIYTATGAVLEAIRIELGSKVESIVTGPGCIRRWFVIVDPGVGFSKTVEGNLEVLRRGGEVVAEVEVGRGPRRKRNPLAGYPTLIGTSRKSFLGTILASARADDSASSPPRSSVHSTSGGVATPTASPRDRIWATAAAVSCAVQQGALIVRAHDVGEMRDVICVADALWS